MWLSRFGLIVSRTKTNQRVVPLWICVLVTVFTSQKIILRTVTTITERKGNVEGTAMGPDVEYVAER